MNSNELNNYINSLNEFGNNELKVNNNLNRKVNKKTNKKLWKYEMRK